MCPRNRHQNHLPASSPHTIAIYGHDAKAGLQVNPHVRITPSPNQSSQPKRKAAKKTKKETGLRYAFGLDSGCGHGLKLTALILEAAPHGVEHRIEQVDCSGPVHGAQEDGEDVDQEEEEMQEGMKAQEVMFARHDDDE